MSCLRLLAPACAVFPIGNARSRRWPGPRSSHDRAGRPAKVPVRRGDRYRRSIERAVVRRGVELAQRVAHRKPPVRAAAGRRLLEPLRVELAHFAARHERAHRVVDDLTEGRVAVAHHERIRLGRLRRADDHPVRRLRHVGARAREQDVVHHVGHGAARFEHAPSLAVVVRAEHLHVHVAIEIHAAQHALGRRALIRDHGLAREVRKIVNTRVAAREQARIGDEKRVGELHLALARAGIGRDAADQIDAAVLHERHEILRRDGDKAHAQPRPLRARLDRRDHAVAYVLRKADDLAVRIDGRKRHRGLAVADRDRVGVADLVERGLRDLRARQPRPRHGGRRHRNERDERDGHDGPDERGAGGGTQT
ncbi:hypothetical protein PT2222_30130 [Paraburkholderia tropica]